MEGKNVCKNHCIVETLTIENIFFRAQWYRIGDKIFMYGIIKLSPVYTAVRDKCKELLSAEIEDFHFSAYRNKFVCEASKAREFLPQISEVIQAHRF